MGQSAKPQVCDGPQMAGYRLRRARTAQDFARVYQLRRARFGVGEDDFDADATQVMVEEAGQLLATFRLRAYANGAALGGSYAAQFYDLGALAGMTRPALELGRFCLATGMAAHADVLRLAFAGMAAQVDALGAAMLFGCASFAGAEVAPHRASLALLARHIGQDWPIGLRAAAGVDLGQLYYSPDQAADALRGIPPLLRSYLGIGGWVGGYAVQDYALGTIHVFTAVEVAAIPPARARALRALAQQMVLE